MCFRFLCDRYYLTSPSMKLEMHNAVEKGKPISIVAVPSHLYHMMFELFKVGNRERENSTLRRVAVFLTETSQCYQIERTHVPVS